MEDPKSPKTDFPIQNNTEACRNVDLESENIEPSSIAQHNNSVENNDTTNSAKNMKRKRVDQSDDEEEDVTNAGVKTENSSLDANDAGEKAEDGEEKRTAEQTVFANDYLLWTILKDSKFEDLKEFRQVNRLWNLEATKLLLKIRGMLPIEVKDLTFKPEMEDINDGPPLTLSFQQFSQFVSQSMMFPCYSLRVLDPIERLLLNEDSLSFFQAHGDLFDKLHISFGKSMETGLLAVQTYFGKFFPNLTSLTICTFFPNKIPFPSPLISNSSFVEMKKLKKLKLTGDIPKAILERLLRISPNLDKISWTKNSPTVNQCNFLKSLIDLDSILLLKKFSLILSPKSIETYEQMLEKNFKFEEIDEIRFHSKLSPTELIRASQVLTKVLKSCSETVTKIEKMYALGNAVDLKFPVFPNVTFVSVMFVKSMLSPGPEPTPLFPPTADANFSNLFPNLTRFEFVYRKDAQINLATIFQEPIIPLKKVKELLVGADREDPSRFIPTSWVKQFCKIFPNVTCAYFPTLYESALEHVWKLDFLEELNFDFAVNSQVESYPKVDAAFTGLSEESVKELYCSLEKDSKCSEIDFKALCVKPSIADLKNLKKLGVQLVDQDVVNSNNIGQKQYKKLIVGTDNAGNILSINDNVIFSHVAMKFITEMCPQRESFMFEFDEERLLIKA